MEGRDTPCFTPAPVRAMIRSSQRPRERSTSFVIELDSGKRAATTTAQKGHRELELEWPVPRTTSSRPTRASTSQPSLKSLMRSTSERTAICHPAEVSIITSGSRRFDQTDLSMPPSSPPPFGSIPTNDTSPIHSTLPPSTGYSAALSRKSILRRPSETPSSADSSKRARFSLGPEQLPSRSSHAYYIPGQDDDDTRDDLLFDTSSPMSSLASVAPDHNGLYTSSLTSKELRVRAADVGVHLGPGHTGRLPPSLIRTIAAAKASPSRTHGQSRDQSLPLLSTYTTTKSSMYHGHVRASTAVFPTPPPSSSSRSSLPPAPTATATALVSSSPVRTTARLMLPPPLPDKCFHSTPPLSTGSSSSQARSRSISLGTPTPKANEDRKDRFGRVVLHPASAPTARAFAGKESMGSLNRSRTPVVCTSMEWGLDEDAGEQARMWRASSTEPGV